MGDQVLEKETLKSEENNRKVYREGEFDLLSLAEAGKVLGIGQNKIYQLVNEGELPFIYGLSGRKIRRGALYDFILAHETRNKKE